MCLWVTVCTVRKQRRSIHQHKKKECTENCVFICACSSSRNRVTVAQTTHRCGSSEWIRFSSGNSQIVYDIIRCYKLLSCGTAKMPCALIFYVEIHRVFPPNIYIYICPRIFRGCGVFLCVCVCVKHSVKNDIRSQNWSLTKLARRRTLKVGSPPTHTLAAAKRVITLHKLREVYRSFESCICMGTHATHGGGGCLTCRRLVEWCMYFTWYIYGSLLYSSGSSASTMTPQIFLRVVEKHTHFILLIHSVLCNCCAHISDITCSRCILTSAPSLAMV